MFAVRSGRMVMPYFLVRSWATGFESVLRPLLVTARDAHARQPETCGWPSESPVPEGRGEIRSEPEQALGSFSCMT